MSNKIFLNTLLLATMMLGGSSAVFSMRENAMSDGIMLQNEVTSNETTHVAQALQPREVAKTVVEPTVENSVHLPRTRLNAFVTGSTTTEKSKALDITLSSTITCYTSSGRQVMTKVTSQDFNEFKEPAQQQDETKRPRYKGEIVYLTSISENHPIVIPSRLAKTKSYFIDVDTIGKGLGALDSTKHPMGLIPEEKDRSKLKNIVIPAEIKNIHPKAFEQIPNEGKGVTFNVMSAKDATDITFDETVFPSQATVNWSYVPVDDPATKHQDEKKYIEERLTPDIEAVTESKPNEINFIAGYKENAADGLNLPFYLQYDSTYQGVKSTKLIDLNANLISVNKDAKYNLISANNLDLRVNIPIQKGEVVDDNSLKFLNIFQGRQDPTTKEWTPIMGKEADSIEEANENGLFYVEGLCSYSYDKPVDLSKFITTEFEKITVFGDYTSLNVKVNATHEAFKTIKKSYYNNNIKRIKNGTFEIRTRFMLLNSMTLRIYYGLEAEPEFVDLKISSKYDHYNLDADENGNLNFLFKNSDIGEGFNPREIRGATLYNFNLSNDIYQNDRHSPLNGTKIQMRFGFSDMMKLQDTPAPVYNLSAVIGITFGVYVGLFIIATTIYFFIAKEKYKNDEFRRVKPKLFFKNAAIAFLGIGILLLTGLFIYSRWWPLDNSIVVYNPTDPLVIGFAVASILVIGYYVKFFMNAYKTHKERVKIEKLKLQEDADDDGTK